MESNKEELLRIKRDTEAIKKWCKELDDEMLIEDAEWIVRDK